MPQAAFRQFVEGSGLDQKLGGKPLRPREAATLVKTLARAITPLALVIVIVIVIVNFDYDEDYDKD